MFVVAIVKAVGHEKQKESMFIESHQCQGVCCMAGGLSYDISIQLSFKLPGLG